ncbi:MAG: glutamyl-tRNA reductase, partial [Cyanobacteria bacterium P01_H01_bin.121]
SISSAAAELAQLKLTESNGEHGLPNSLDGCKIAILGAGKMARLLVQHLVSKGATQIVLVNRSRKRADALAKQFGADATIEVRLLDEMLPTVATADLVFTSTSATEPILTRDNLEPVLQPERPLMLVDIAVPLNVHTNVSQLQQVWSFNVDDLKAVVAQNQASRRQMAQEAEGLLEEEASAFEAWLRSLETVPTINSLRAKIETIREQELEKALSRLGSEFGEKHQEIIEALTRGIVNKILHDPMVQLRAQQDIEARQRAMDSLKTLFNLEPEEQFS